jgi:expansin (peptidoglycan-binding protein)
MPRTAQGIFEVKTAPLAPDEATAATSIGRFSLDKAYRGDLEGASAGEMLGGGNPATGTAGYVAMEQVTGTLHGRRGSFALQHFGSMQDGKFDLNVRVVPGSGTGELEGIAGDLTIIIESGKHSYSFEYTLPAVQ